MLSDLDADLPLRWTPLAQERYAELMAVAAETRVWYCRRGRACDGLPHDEYSYPHARSDQWPPPLAQQWLVWLMISGRGAGKTRAGAEWVRRMTAHVPRIAMVAATVSDLRDTMVEGDSGLLQVCQYAGYMPHWESSKKRLTFPNGAVVVGFSAEEPDRLRGPNHAAAWCDEPAHYENVAYVWDMLMYGLRKGNQPRVAVTTTPKPSPWLRELIEDAGTRTVVVSTFANEANLAPAFVKKMRTRYAGTRQGRQELFGEILEDVEGALWSGALLDLTRVGEAPDLVRTVVGVDPAGTSTQRSDETGIVVVGMGVDRQLYVLADYSSVATPLAWANDALRAAAQWNADAVVAETNYGGEMVTANLRAAAGRGGDLGVRIKAVNSRRGKLIRAEPVFSKFEQDKAHVVGNTMGELEAQLCSWVPGSGKSPDRLDALVHAAHELVGVGDGSIAVAHGPLPNRTRVPVSKYGRDLDIMRKGVFGALPG